MVLPFFNAAFLTAAYYYNAKTSFFTHTDPVPWLRLVLGRELVITMYMICGLRMCVIIACPFAILFPFRGSMLTIGLTAFVVAFYMSLSTSDTILAIYDYATWLSLWSASTSILQPARHFLAVMFLFAEAILRLIPLSLFFACDCLFVFCFAFVLSRIICDCVKLYSSKATPQPRRKFQHDRFERSVATDTSRL